MTDLTPAPNPPVGVRERDHAGALNDRGWYRVLRGDFAGGLEDAERSLALRPDDADTLGTRCFALAGLGGATRPGRTARARQRSIAQI